MINTDVQNSIQNHMNTLPDYMQEAIHASGWERKILAIGRKYGLHIDQLDVLQTELSLVILGLSDRDEFVREVTHEAGISSQIMNGIVSEINHDIFEPIRERLHEYQQKHTQETQSSGDDEGSEENEVVETSVSGLEKHEEDVLKSHGVLFGDDELTTQSVTNSDSNKWESQEPNNQKSLETPLILSKEKKDLSFSELMSLGPKDSTQEQTQTVSSTSSVLNTPQKPQMKSASQNQTTPQASTSPTQPKPSVQSGNQQAIRTASSEGYQTQDPYREPIT